jgi:hypothetical protein
MLYKKINKLYFFEAHDLPIDNFSIDHQRKLYIDYSSIIIMLNCPEI